MSETLKKALSTAALITLPFEPSGWREEARKLRRLAFWVNAARETVLYAGALVLAAYVGWLTATAAELWIYAIPFDSIDWHHLVTHPFIADPVGDYAKTFDEVIQQDDPFGPYYAP